MPAHTREAAYNKKATDETEHGQGSFQEGSMQSDTRRTDAQSCKVVVTKQTQLKGETVTENKFFGNSLPEITETLKQNQQASANLRHLNPPVTHRQPAEKKKQIKKHQPQPQKNASTEPEKRSPLPPPTTGTLANDQPATTTPLPNVSANNEMSTPLPNESCSESLPYQPVRAPPSKVLPNVHQPVNTGASPPLSPTSTDSGLGSASPSTTSTLTENEPMETGLDEVVKPSGLSDGDPVNSHTQPVPALNLPNVHQPANTGVSPPLSPTSTDSDDSGLGSSSSSTTSTLIGDDETHERDYSDLDDILEFIKPDADSDGGSDTETDETQQDDD